MRILNRLGDIPLPSAYTCIKAISKKKLETIAKFRSEFAAGAERKGMSNREATELFGLIEHFAGYGFNKSHSTAYALIAYITAYLKAHYPVEFMAALLSGDMPDRNFKKKDSLVEHREDCLRMEIEVLPPDVNRSQPEFTVECDRGKKRIVFGLGAIKGCGGNAAHAILAARQSGGPIRSLFDFCARIDPAACNRTAIESLIKAGAFDTLGGRRAALTASLDRALQTGAAALADRRSGQKGLFNDLDEDDGAGVDAVNLPDVPEWDERQKLAHEKEVLGFYLKSHPLAEHAAKFKTYTTHSTAAIPDVAHRTEVVLGGMLASLKFAHTKNPRPGSSNTKYVMFDLEDLEGMLRCIVWPEQFAEFGHLVQPDAILLVRGAVDRRPGSEESNLIVNELIPLEDLAARYTQGIEIRLQEAGLTEDRVERLYEILRGYPGKCRVEISISLVEGGEAVLKSEKVHVAVEAELRGRLDDLLGAGHVRLITARPSVARPAHFQPGRERNGSPRAKAMS